MVAIGRGIFRHSVKAWSDFKAVFQTLNDAGFYGPFTMELEGIEGETVDEAGIQARVADSLQHLKDIEVL